MWDYKEKFKSIESNVEEKNELINKTQLKYFIDNSFNQGNTPKSKFESSRYSGGFRNQQKKKYASQNNSIERSVNKNEVYSLIKNVRYGDLFISNAPTPRNIEE